MPIINLYIIPLTECDMSSYGPSSDISMSVTESFMSRPTVKFLKPVKMFMAFKKWKEMKEFLNCNITDERLAF